MLMCNLKSQRKLNKSSTRNRNTRTNLIVYILTRFSMLCIYVCPVGLLGIKYVLQDWLSWSENYWTALRILLSLLRCEWTNETSRKWLTVVIWLSWTVMDDFHGWLSWMTFMDDFTKFSWLKLFLHIVYGQTDRLTLVLVKSLSRLKIMV